MNIKRVKYKMSKTDEWKVGYVIGNYDGQNETLLDKDFRYVPKITHNEKSYLVYDMKDDIENQINITIPHK